MVNENFWKDNYKEFWAIAASKEEKVKKLIEHECKCQCEFIGLGAGKTDYLSGSAKSQGFKKGGSDLHVVGTNIYVEVTGPNINVARTSDLWIRPDKIEYAIANLANDHWVVHALHQDFYLRTIHMDDSFKADYINGKLRLVYPFIRGVHEKYISIPANSNYVKEADALFVAIKEKISKH